MSEEEKLPESGEQQQDTHRYSKEARYGARIALILFVLILGAAFYNIVIRPKPDGGAVVVASIAALIVFPVLAYLILWSLKVIFKRSEESRPFQATEEDDRTSGLAPEDTKMTDV